MLRSVGKCKRCNKPDYGFPLSVDGYCQKCARSCQKDQRPITPQSDVPVSTPTYLSSDAHINPPNRGRSGSGGKFGGLKDVFKGKEYKQQLSELQEKYDSLCAMMTPDMQTAQQMQLYIKQLENRKSDILSEIDASISTQNKLLDEISRLQSIIKDQQKNIIVNDETIEMETFSLYQPRFAFASSEEYKYRINKIRDAQKDMIKRGVAATAPKSWTLNNSPSQGRKMVNDMVKLCIRSFNNECDTAVADVKFSNFDRCLNRIYKSAESIEKLGKIMCITIRPDYINSKVEELRLALEYQIKKQEEKEIQKEIRARQREEAKLAAEIAEARKNIDKERNHYERAYEQIKQQVSVCTSEVEKALLLEKQREIETKLGLIEEQIKKLDYREANQKAGYVYIISNIGSFGEDVYKIGMTRRLDPMDRIDELSVASVPFSFDVHAMIFTDDAPKLEAALHNAFKKKKVNLVNTRKEFFRVTLSEIKQVIKDNFDKTVEFKDVPDAEQFRESKLICKGNYNDQ